MKWIKEAFVGFWRGFFGEDWQGWLISAIGIGILMALIGI